MRNLREILRLRFQASLSLRQIQSSQRVSLGAVQGIVSQATAQGLDWSSVEQLDDSQLAQLFYPESDVRVSSQFQLPDWVQVHQELKRKGVTRHLLWEEYTQAYPNRSYSYPQYCYLYQAWEKSRNAPCVRPTRRVTNYLWIMPDRPCR